MNKTSSVGTNNVTDVFGKLSLSAELKGFLAALEAKLVLTFSPGSETPEFKIVDERGKPVCTIDELKKLGGFRRFTNESLKVIEKDNHSSERVKLVAQFITKFSLVNETSPGRMEESNEAKFKQFYSMFKIIEENLEKVSTCGDCKYRTYLLEKGAILEGVIIKMMVGCFSAEKLPKEEYKKMLLSHYVPKWLAAKFIDKQFTANVSYDAMVLLFPRGNYYKSVSLTTEEIKDQDFLDHNHTVIENSGSIIELAGKDWSVLFPPTPPGLDAEVDAIYNEYNWTLISPITTQEILNFRATGKSPPVYKTRGPQVLKNRKESEIETFKRVLHNKIGLLIATWLDFFNLIIPMENPPKNFWAKIAPEIGRWTFTPNSTLYQQLKDNKTKIDSIRALSNEAILALMGEVCIQKLDIPLSSTMGKDLLEFFKDLKGKNQITVKKAEDLPTIPIYMGKEDVFVEDIPNSKTELAKTYLGMVKLPSKKGGKKSQAAARRLSVEALAELDLIKDHASYNMVYEWLSTSFTSGKYHLVQKLAASLVAAEVLKYKDVLLDDDFDELEYLDKFDDTDAE